MSAAEDALRSLQKMVNAAGISVSVPDDLLKLENFAVLARYEVDPTPLPASREHLIALLDSLHALVRRKVGD